MSSKWFADKKKINSFLSFKYIPEKNIELPEEIIKSCSKSVMVDHDRSGLIEKGKKALEDGFEKFFSKYPKDMKFVVPLSGGLDSRAILGFLINNVQEERIITFTVGTPGTLDYEIGKKVAKKADVNNYMINCTPNKFPWTEKFLLKSAKKYERPTELFRMGDVSWFSQEFFDKKFEEEYVFLTGYLGGELAGSHVPKEKSKSWKESINNFLKNNYYYPDLTSDDFNPKSVLPDDPLVNKDILNFDEQLDFGIRQRYYIRPSIVFNENVKTPFVSEPWLNFILNIPNKYKRYRNLYRDIIKSLYPDIFSIGVSTNVGLPLSTNPIYHELYRKYINFYEKIKTILGYNHPKFTTYFFDWDVELRRSNSFFKMVNKQLTDLKKRSSVGWLDPCRFLNKHLKGVNYGKEIKILTSLEIFLKAEKN